MAQSISVQDFNKLPLDADSIVLDTRNTLDYNKKPLKPLAFYPRCYLAKTIKKSRSKETLLYSKLYRQAIRSISRSTYC
ncbi:hypothetical protein EfmJHP10_24280 [Enterococcus faecium]|nr:hypothetical protein EfmJHP10_24280 [Enterococcus faecium]